MGPPGGIQVSPEGTEFRTAELQCDPFIADWSSVGLLHVYGAAVIPDALYSIRTASEECVLSGQQWCMGFPFHYETNKWGDVTEPYLGSAQPNFGDITYIVDAFKNSMGTDVRADLLGPGSTGQPNTPDEKSNFVDITAAVDAFKGQSFTYTVELCP